MSKKYYLGLDIGTNSVGWAVTDENYNLCKYAGKRMWGIRLFEGGETAEQRRISRSNRRRLSRKKQRIDLLQELFAEEIAKMDPTFFIRLNESRLHLEDKSTGEKFPLFTDKDYTDIQYYKEYPTIYHLRKELIENSKVHDVRLVYLACHHILKNRGHFLINGSFSDVKKLSSVCESMLNSFNGISKYQLEINDIERLEEILSDRKKQKSVKAKELIQIFECGPCEDKTDEKTCKAIVSNLCKWLTGLKGNINSIFDMQFEEIDTSSFSFTEPKYEDTISAALEEKYPDFSSYVYCMGNPVKLIDPQGTETHVAQNEDGTYRVIGGELNNDKNIYLYSKDKNGNYTIRGKSIGISTSTTSFYNSDKKKWAIGSTINPKDGSGENFLNNLVENKPPLFDDYMNNARTGQLYDFKYSNGTINTADDGQDIYRGMPVGVTGKGQDIFTSARDIGNIAAGYIAGINGMSWNASRIAFDAYQSYSSGKPTIEGISTRNAEYYGWRIGSNIKNYTPDKKATNLSRSVWHGLKSFGKYLYDGIKSVF